MINLQVYYLFNNFRQISLSFRTYGTKSLRMFSKKKKLINAKNKILYVSLIKVNIIHS
jgi:hypothetical protein